MPAQLRCLEPPDIFIRSRGAAESEEEMNQFGPGLLESRRAVEICREPQRSVVVDKILEWGRTAGSPRFVRR